MVKERRIKTLANKLLKKFHDIIIFSYHLIGVFALYSILFGIVSYVSYMGFYGISTSWCVPTILTNSEDKILQMTQQVVVSSQALGTLVLNKDQAQITLLELEKHRNILIHLDNSINKQLPNELAEDSRDIKNISSIRTNLDSINKKLSALTSSSITISEQIDSDLKKGLITKTDALQMKSALIQLNTTEISDNIQNETMKENIWQKEPSNIQWSFIRGQQENLNLQLAQIDIAIDTSKKEIEMDNNEILQLENAMDRVKNSPYYLVSSANNKMVFAFVPYSNKDNAFVGSNIYNCYLSMIICKRVGRVKALFSDEEVLPNPVLETQMRGFLVELDLTDKDAGQSKTLMLRRKPFLF